MQGRPVRQSDTRVGFGQGVFGIWMGIWGVCTPGEDMEITIRDWSAFPL